MLSILVKFLTDRWTDIKTDTGKTIKPPPSPDLSMQGHNKMCL